MATTTTIEKNIINNPKVASLPQLEAYSKDYLAALEAGYRPSTTTLTKMFDSLDNVTSGKPSLMAALTAVETEIVEQVFLRDPRLATNTQLAPMLSFYAGVIANGYEPDAATAAAIADALEGVTTTNPTLISLLETITQSLSGPAPEAVASSIVFLDGTAPGAIEGKLSGHHPDGLAVSFALDPNGAPAHGDLVIRADGTYSYTPDAGYAGTDAFTFVVTDSEGRSSTATVSVQAGATIPLDYASFGVSGTTGHDVLLGGESSLYEFATIFDPDNGRYLTVLNYTYQGTLYLNGGGAGDTGDDTITGRAYNFYNHLMGEAGNDVLTGGAKSGTNFLVGGIGNDILTGGADSMRNELHGGVGNDILIGGEAEGNITLDHRSPNYLYGGSGDDILTGGSYYNLLDGGTGTDRINGGTGQDDVVLGDVGVGDFADGGGQYLYVPDTLTLIGGAAGEVMTAVGQEAFVDGRLIGQNFQSFTFVGGAGNDTLTGGDGFDGPWAIYPQNNLFGGAGRDVLHGGAARDWLAGGTDDDLLTGGAGRDHFAFVDSENAGTDTVTDFEVGVDLISVPGEMSLSEAHVGGDGAMLDTVVTLSSYSGASLGTVVLLDVSGLNQSVLIWGTWSPPQE